MVGVFVYGLLTRDVEALCERAPDLSKSVIARTCFDDGSASCVHPEVGRLRQARRSCTRLGGEWRPSAVVGSDATPKSP